MNINKTKDDGRRKNQWRNSVNTQTHKHKHTHSHASTRFLSHFSGLVNFGNMLMKFVKREKNNSSSSSSRMTWHSVGQCKNNQIQQTLRWSASAYRVYLANHFQWLEVIQSQFTIIAYLCVSLTNTNTDRHIENRIDTENTLNSLMKKTSDNTIGLNQKVTHLSFMLQITHSAIDYALAFPFSVWTHTHIFNLTISAEGTSFYFHFKGREAKFSFFLCWSVDLVCLISKKAQNQFTGWLSS